MTTAPMRLRSLPTLPFLPMRQRALALLPLLPLLLY